MNSLRDLQRDWELLGESDPLHAVLNDPAAAGRRWSPVDFLATGEQEIRIVFEWLRKNAIEPARSGQAMDFGCGPGRLTQALARRFERATGVDISRPMLEAARRLAPPANCDFVLNQESGLPAFPDGRFDFIYSSIVLQHIPPPHTLNYLKEFFRILAPGGLLVFQIPLEKNEPFAEVVRRNFFHVRSRLKIGVRLRVLLGKESREALAPKEEGLIHMHCIPEGTLAGLFTSEGMEVAAKGYSNSCELSFNGALKISADPTYSAHFLSGLFAVRKPRKT